MQTNKLPELYQTFIQPYLTRNQWLKLALLISLIQVHRWVRLEDLANRLPQPVKFESRRRGIQRLLDLPQLTYETLWFPLFSLWLSGKFKPGEVVNLAIDRTRWGEVNLLVISCLYRRRAIPIYMTFLPKKGNSNLSEQQDTLSRVFPLLEAYKTVVLGDREFCGVQLAQWLSGRKNTYFCLRLKKNTYVAREDQLWTALRDLGLSPGMSFYLEGMKVTKSRGFHPGNLAVKWKQKYRGWTADEAWFILTNLPDLKTALDAYAQRMGIEEMFRDFKSGGYNLEDTQVRGKRLVTLTLLMTLAYASDIFHGEVVRRKGVNSYVNRPSEKGRKYPRHSHFYTGNRARAWLHSLTVFAEEAQQFLKSCPHKRVNYRQGQRAISLIQSSF